MSIFDKFSFGKVGVFVTLFAVFLDMMFVVNLPVASAGEVELGLDGAYYDSEVADHIYALFTTDLSGMADAIPSLAGYFDLLNEGGVSCGVATSASFMASFHDVSNQFVDLTFSGWSCPEATNPADLKFTDPGNAENYDLAGGIEDVAAIEGGGGADPEVSFTSASSITQTSASLTGEIVSTADKTITRRGFRIGTDTSYGVGTVAVDDMNGFSTGTYSLDSPTLSCSTTYHVQALVRDSENVDYYGDDATFNTVTCSVLTGDATNIETNAFTLNGTLFVTATEYFTGRGFQYGTTASYGQTITDPGSWGSGTYNFYSNLNSGVECNTTYYFRAYAVSSSNQTFYGSGKSLTTSSCSGGGDGDGAVLDASYVDGTNFGTVYALFSVDLSSISEAIPSLAGNFYLVDSNDASCAIGSSASLMASFHDISNKFVQVGFSGISCPDTGSPVGLKFMDPSGSGEFSIESFQDVSAIGVVTSNAVTEAEAAGNLVCQFVDADWQSLSTLSLSMPSSSYDAGSSVSSSLTLGSDDAFILIANPTSTATWTLSIAPTDGATTLWSDGGSNSADFNDDADGSDGDDTDGVGGRLSVNLSGATITPYSGDYNTTGLSVGSNNAFDEGTVDSVTLLTAGGTANAPGYWGLKGVSLTQMFPAGQAIGSYSLDLTISVI